MACVRCSVVRLGFECCRANLDAPIAGAALAIRACERQFSSVVFEVSDTVNRGNLSCEGVSEIYLARLHGTSRQPEDADAENA